MRSQEPEIEVCVRSCCTEVLHKDEGVEASQPASSTSIRYNELIPVKLNQKDM